jgi:hypothetical protein
VTAIAFHIQDAYNALLELLTEGENEQSLEEDKGEARDEELASQVFILGELLRIAVQLDYADEIGRRKVFTIVREWYLCLSLRSEELMICRGCRGHDRAGGTSWIVD